MKSTIAISAFALLSIVAACSSDDANGTRNGGCVPAAQTACACVDGTEGFQVCDASGTTFSACSCTGSATTSSGGIPRPDGGAELTDGGREGGAITPNPGPTTKKCVGSPNTCSSHHNIYDCQTVVGCTWNGCGGSAQSCSYSSSASCEQQDGCSYSGLYPSGHCGGSPKACSAYRTDESGCGSQDGCHWDGCGGTANACATKTDETNCVTQYGCRWE